MVLVVSKRSLKICESEYTPQGTTRRLGEEDLASTWQISLHLVQLLLLLPVKYDQFPAPSAKGPLALLGPSPGGNHIVLAREL